MPRPAGTPISMALRPSWGDRMSEMETLQSFKAARERAEKAGEVVTKVKFAQEAAKAAAE